MKNIIVTGCSYSQKSGVPIAYPDMLNESSDVNVKSLAWPGQSNDTIIRNVKEQIRDGVTDTLFICQLTHLHRMAKFCTLNQKWIDFQPGVVNTRPTIKDDKITFDVLYTSDKNSIPNTGNRGGVGIYGARSFEDVELSEQNFEEFLDWYGFYLKYIYDDEHTFYELHNSIDELSKQVKDSGNDILYIYWPDIIYNKEPFCKNNFLSIDGEYSMLRWSVKNKLTQQKDSHLSINGHIKLSEEIAKKINIKLDINKQFLIY